MMLYKILIAAGAYLLSIGLGHLLITRSMDHLRSEEVTKYLEPKYRNTPDYFLVKILGALERTWYTSCFLVGKPEGIVAWLAFKVLTKLGQQTHNTKPDSTNNIDPDLAYITRMNLYMIGNLLTLFYAGSIGYIAHWWISKL